MSGMCTVQHPGVEGTSMQMPVMADFTVQFINGDEVIINITTSDRARVTSKS